MTRAHALLNRRLAYLRERYPDVLYLAALLTDIPVCFAPGQAPCFVSPRRYMEPSRPATPFYDLSRPFPHDTNTFPLFIPFIILITCMLYSLSLRPSLPEETLLICAVHTCPYSLSKSSRIGRSAPSHCSARNVSGYALASIGGCGCIKCVKRAWKQAASGNILRLFTAVRIASLCHTHANRTRHRRYRVRLRH